MSTRAPPRWTLHADPGHRDTLERPGGTSGATLAPRTMMVVVEGPNLVPGSQDTVGEHDRDASTARICDLFGRGQVSLEEFYGVLDLIFSATSRADLEAAMRALPPPVRLTPLSLRLTEPLLLRMPDGAARLGAGWQLAAATSITTGSGATQLDLNAASWDALVIDLHLETWGSIEVLVPRGVAVQVVGGSGRVRIRPLSPPIPGGPLVRIKISGPAGVIFVRHLEDRLGESFTRRRRSAAAGSP